MQVHRHRVAPVLNRIRILHTCIYKCTCTYYETATRKRIVQLQTTANRSENDLSKKRHNSELSARESSDRVQFLLHRRLLHNLANWERIWLKFFFVKVVFCMWNTELVPHTVPLAHFRVPNWASIMYELLSRCLLTNLWTLKSNLRSNLLTTIVNVVSFSFS